MNKQKLVVLGMLLVILGGVFAMNRLVFATDLSDLSFAETNAITFYEQTKAKYPQNEVGPIIIIEKASGFRTLDDYLWIANFTAELEAFEEIDNVSSITNLKLPYKGLFGPVYKPYIDLNSTENFKNWQEKEAAFEDVNQKFISHDKKYTLIYLSADEGLNNEQLNHIHTIDSTNESIEISVLQEDLTAAALKSEWLRESLLIAVICIALILISFFFFTRSFRALGFILFIILFNLSATLIFMVLNSIAFNIQMIALPCLIILFSFSDVLHILFHHSRLVSQGISQNELAFALKAELSNALFFTSFSNIFGFLIFLLLSDNKLLGELAIVAIFSVVIAYLSGRYLVINSLPTTFTFISYDQIKRVQTRSFKLLNRIKLNKSISFYGLVTLTIFTSILVINNFKIDTQRGGYMVSNPTLRHSQEILTSEFYGAKSIEVEISYADSSAIWDLEQLKTIENLEVEIAELLHPRYAVSPVIIVKRYNRYLVNGRPEAFKLPPVLSTNSVATLNQNYKLLGGDQLIAPHYFAGRILIGLDDIGLAESIEAYEKLKSLLDSFSNNKLKFSLSGTSYLTDQATYSFSNKLIFAWIFATLLSSIVLMFYLRSFLKGIIVFLVNMLPIITVVYLMPYFGLNINPQSLFLLTILAGLCVDDSIYLILNKVQKRSELSYFPIVVTSIVLAAGFLAFGFSSYSWLSPFALLFIIGILMALMLDLIIVPLFMFKTEEHDI